jgi:hypothetical protein
MDSMRLAGAGEVALWLPCCRCGESAVGWDRINEKAYCPECQEAIIQGEGEPLVETTCRRPCVVCATVGAVTVETFPRGSIRAVEMQLCPYHLRGLLGRSLGEAAYTQLRRRLRGLGIAVAEVFLLHEAFYDTHGRALQPTAEPEV